MGWDGGRGGGGGSERRGVSPHVRCFQREPTKCSLEKDIQDLTFSICEIKIKRSWSRDYSPG